MTQIKETLFWKLNQSSTIAKGCFFYLRNQKEIMGIQIIFEIAHHNLFIICMKQCIYCDLFCKKTTQNNKAYMDVEFFIIS